MEECRKKIEACNGDLECALRVAMECGSPLKGQERKMGKFWISNNEYNKWFDYVMKSDILYFWFHHTC